VEWKKVDVAIDFKARQLTYFKLLEILPKILFAPKKISVLAYESSILVRFKFYD
jgi:hypothetical protein